MPPAYSVTQTIVWSQGAHLTVNTPSKHTTLAYSAPVNEASSTARRIKAPNRPDFWATAQSCQADSGHFDELHGCVARGKPGAAPLSETWKRFFRSDHDLQTRPQRLPQALPWLIEASAWQEIEAGVEQRAALLEQIMADVYGPQQLLDQGLLPAELVFGQPGYLRAMHGVNAVGGSHLRIVGFDLMRQPNGRWCVLRQHCQVAAGWGLLLGNRASSASLLPGTLEALPVRPLADSLDAMLRALQKDCPSGPDAALALLSPGPQHPAYGEHCELARELGLTLLRASELTLHGQALCLKAVQGLLPVSAMIKCVDDDDLDPLELRADASLGVPGLLQTIRAGKLLLANAPGSAFLETPSLTACLPALSRHLLGAELELSTLEATPGPACDQASQLPVWLTSTDLPDAQWQMQSVTLRVFAWSGGNRTWHVLPGGLARFAGAPIHSGDVWVLRAEALGATGAVASQVRRPGTRLRLLSRRAAEQLFWLGRYSERCANVISLARLAMACLAPERPLSQAMLAWLGNLAVQNGLLAADGTQPWLDHQALGDGLRSKLAPGRRAACIADKLRAMSATADDVLEHLPAQHVQAIERVQAMARPGHTEPGMRDLQTSAPWLDAAGLELAAIIALQTGDQVQEEVGRLLGIGHSVERLGFQAAALHSGLLSGNLQTVQGLEALRRLFDGGVQTLTSHGPSARPSDLLAALLTGDAATHSLGASARTLRLRLAGQQDALQDPLSRLAWRVPDPFNWASNADPMVHLNELLQQCLADTFELSDAICSTCFRDSFDQAAGV